MTMVPTRFEAALARIDAANTEDPNLESEGGSFLPKELLYGRRMSLMLDRFEPQASEAMRLAVRAQHIQRWKIPRDTYPQDRAGYLQWRTRLYEFHAQAVSTILRELGYPEVLVTHVADAVAKKHLKESPETQLLEDIAGLVFLQHYLAGFAEAHREYSEDKWVNIIQKTWVKLSPRAHAFALGGGIELPARLASLVKRAVSAVA